MKLYQALTQIQIGDTLPDDAAGWTITTELDQPLFYAPSTTYHYLDAVLKAGSRHDENNLRYVTDPAFIGENFDFTRTPETAALGTFEERMTFARHVVADLNRHLSVNLDVGRQEFQLLFVD